MLSPHNSLQVACAMTYYTDTSGDYPCTGINYQKTSKECQLNFCAPIRDSGSYMTSDSWITYEMIYSGDHSGDPFKKG